MCSWGLGWEVLFARADLATQEGSNGPKLGVNYIQASAPSTALAVAGGTSLTVGQDLAKYGIAGVVWNCARAMVSFFEAEPQLVANQHVLELGAGPGAVGLALASGGAVSSLLLTDLEKVVPLTRQNVRASREQNPTISALDDRHCLDVRALSWLSIPDLVALSTLLSVHVCSNRGEPLDAAIANRSIDVVIASDCLYEPSAHSALLTMLLDLTEQESGQPRRVIVLLAYKQRVPNKEKAFFQAAAGHFDIAVYSTAESNPSSNNGISAIEYYDEDIYICKLERLHSDKH